MSTGLLLPILPGWPFIIPAVVLLGRRDRVVRLCHLLVRATLRCGHRVLDVAAVEIDAEGAR